MYIAIRLVQHENRMLSMTYRSLRCCCAGVFRQLHLAVVDYVHIAALVLSCFWVQDRPSMCASEILRIVHKHFTSSLGGLCSIQKVPAVRPVLVSA